MKSHIKRVKGETNGNNAIVPIESKKYSFKLYNLYMYM